MGHSIQDYLKKINSSLSHFDTLSLAITAAFLVVLALYVSGLVRDKKLPVLYRAHEAVEDVPSSQDFRPFGSSKGTTYTYSWCPGAESIKSENKIYYENADQAERLGRRISKLCGN